MSRIDKWFSDRPRRRPAEIACLLARDRFWRDERRRLVGTHPDLPDVAMLLELEEELAHGFVLMLGRLPAEHRASFAEAFYEKRSRAHAGWVPSDPHAKLTLAAGVALLIVDLAEPELQDDRIVDLLQGAAQGDDLTSTPEPAVRELRRVIAKIRFDVEFEDPTDPRGAASQAIAEVLDPAGDVVALQAVIARAAWAAAESWESSRTLAFLLAADRLFANAQG